MLEKLFDMPSLRIMEREVFPFIPIAGTRGLSPLSLRIEAAKVRSSVAKSLSHLTQGDL